MNEVFLYGLQAANQELQRQIWDLQHRVEDLDRQHSEARREAYRDLANGLTEMGERIHRVEEGLGLAGP